MISYVLIVIVSLTSGAPAHAVLEGPMSQSWCEQLIESATYRGEDATTRRSSSCMSWPDAERALARYSCTPAGEAGAREQTETFDCARSAASSVDLSLRPPPIEPGRRRLSERYTGILVQGASIAEVPKTFAAADCPRALNVVTGAGEAGHIRCLTVTDERRLLAEARCRGPRVDATGTRWYRCGVDPAPYIGNAGHP